MVMMMMMILNQWYVVVHVVHVVVADVSIE